MFYHITLLEQVVVVAVIVKIFVEWLSLFFPKIPNCRIQPKTSTLNILDNKNKIVNFQCDGHGKNGVETTLRAT